jgi:hypothetical protein
LNACSDLNIVLAFPYNIDKLRGIPLSASYSAFWSANAQVARLCLVVYSCPLPWPDVAPSPTKASATTNTASDRAGHDTKRMCCGLLPEHQWRMCTSSDKKF